jgi:hypothetical protein
MERSIAEQPVMQQTAGEQPAMEQRVFEQPVVRENIVEEVRRTEFAPLAAVAEQLPAPEPVIEKPQVQSVIPRPQAAPAWKMEPVALPSDLVMIETQAKAPANYQEPEAPRPVRTPRPRYQPTVVPEEPLQQVETGNKASGDSA